MKIKILNLTEKYLGNTSEWAKDKEYGSADIGIPVGCPICHAWGVCNFEIIS